MKVYNWKIGSTDLTAPANTEGAFSFAIYSWGDSAFMKEEESLSPCYQSYKKISLLCSKETICTFSAFPLARSSFPIWDDCDCGVVQGIPIRQSEDSGLGQSCVLSIHVALDKLLNLSTPVSSKY